MKTIKRIFVLSFVLFSILSISAQGKFDGSVQLKSMHFWRGIRVSNAPVFTTTVGYMSDGLSVLVWSGVDFTGNYVEVDPVINYKYKNFNITLLDIGNPNGNYLNYDQKTTNHIIDLSLGYNFSFMNIAWKTIVYGNDRLINGDQKYSSYIEFGFPMKHKETSVKPFIAGAFALNTDANANLYCGNNGFSIVNLGVEIGKTVKINEHSFPVGLTFALNPATEQAAVQFAINLF